MKETVSRSDWHQFLRQYTDENSGRPTRLGIFELRGGALQDFWLEDGLPFVGIDLEERLSGPSIEIVLGNYAHRVSDAAEVRQISGDNSEDEGLDILDRNGTTTVLRFEALTRA
jgi:hypothetical protein